MTMTNIQYINMLQVNVQHQARVLYMGVFMIIRATNNMLRSFLESFLVYFMEYFF